MSVQYPKVDGFSGPWPDNNRPGAFYYHNEQTGVPVTAEDLMRALQQRHAQGKPTPTPTGSDHWNIPAPGGQQSSGGMSSARDQLRGGASADPFHQPATQSSTQTNQQQRPATRTTATPLSPYQLVGNDMTALYANGQIRPHHEIAYYPTTHVLALLTDHRGKQAEYVITRRETVDINNHSVIEIEDTLALDNERRLTGGGALTRRRCPDSYRFIKDVVEASTLTGAMDAARVHNIVNGETNTIMPSVVQPTICPLPASMVNPEEQFERLNFGDLPEDADLRFIGNRIEQLMTLLTRMGMGYLRRWFNTALLELVNHVLRFELRAPVSLEKDVQGEFVELIDWFRDEEGQPFEDDFVKQFGQLLRTTLGFEVVELYSQVEGKEDQPVKALSRIMRVPIVTIDTDPEEADATQSNTPFAPVTNGQLIEALTPTLHKLVEEAVVNIRHEAPNQDNYHFILNIQSGNGFEIFAMRRKASGWNFWMKRVIES